MSNEQHHHEFQETQGDEPNIRPEHLPPAEKLHPEKLKDVVHDVVEGLVHFGEGEPPEGADDAGHVEGGSTAP